MSQVRLDSFSIEAVQLTNVLETTEITQQNSIFLQLGNISARQHTKINKRCACRVGDLFQRLQIYLLSERE